MIIMKKTLLLATILAITALTSCTEDTYVGEQNLKAINEGAISFGSATPAVTRAGEGAIAAGLLNNNFVLFGYKTLSDESGTQTQTVFDNYQVNYAAGTANTTESNTADWEYVSYKNLPNGTRTTADGEYNTDGVAANATASGIEQSIKYWDFSASKYDFFAYSLGTGATGESTTWAKASALTNTTEPTYTLEGNKDQLATCYISNKKSLNPAVDATQVKLDFRSFLSKIQLKFYETIPGYSVKDVKFYIDGSTKSTGDADNDGLKPAIYGAANAIPTGGKYTITFNSANQALATLTGDATSAASNILFDAVSTDPSNVWLSDFAEKDYEETAGAVYLGRASNDATGTQQMTVLPNSNGATLTLKMDFTLVSRDGTGETINVTGATATVPAAYTMWKPNYAYTYIFKISDDTNAQSGTATGLYPITLDAVVADAQDGSQTTITTVSTPSITTYQKGAIANEYVASAPIYVVVNDGTSNVVLTVGTNAKLFTATVESGATQGITEATVENAIINGTYDGSAKTYTVTDAAGKKLVLTDTESTLLAAVTSIDATDSPSGAAITVDGAKFTPAAGTTYVFQYEVSSTITTYTKETAAAYNAALPGAVTTSDVIYSFTSFKTGEAEKVYGTGKVKTVSTEGEWTTVEVTENAIAGFVGNRYKVRAIALSEGLSLELKNMDGSDTGISVKDLSSAAYSDEEATTHNAALTGAVTAGTALPSPIPASCQYKVIKVVAP